jgi:hypothetical protein
VSSTFRKNRRGELVVRLQPEELAVLRGLPSELRPLVDEPEPAGEPDVTAADPEADRAPNADESAEDKVRRRLFPLAYLDPTEEEAEKEWQRIVHPDLVRSKLESLSTLAATLERASENKGRVDIVLSPEETEAWLGTLNDARLALGVALNVTEDVDMEARIRAEDAGAPGYAMYAWLTELQAALVDALL